MADTTIFEGKRASYYNTSIRIWHPEYDFIQALVPHILSPYLNLGQRNRALVAGCGTGEEMERLASVFPACSLVGVDPSPQMIAQAEIRLASISSTRIELLTGLVDDLPLESLFDAATLILVLHFLPDNGAKLHLLQTISKRLKTGSPLVVIDIFGTGPDVEFNLAILESLLLANGTGPDFVAKGIEHIRTDIHFVPEERQLELLNLAGFRNVKRFAQTLIFGGWVAEKV